MGHLDFDIVSDFASFDPLHLSRTLYKSALFMQNKANLMDAQMNVSAVLTKDYENERLSRRGENKPNQSQFQTQHLSKLFLAFLSLLEIRVTKVGLS